MQVQSNQLHSRIWSGIWLAQGGLLYAKQKFTLKQLHEIGPRIALELSQKLYHLMASCIPHCKPLTSKSVE